MATKATLTFRDYSGELSRMTVNLPDLTALNYAGVTQDLDEIHDAIVNNDMIRGEIISVQITQDWIKSTSEVTDNEAQREKKFVVHYTDPVPYLDTGGTLVNPGYGKAFTFEIATAKLEGHMVANSEDDLVDLDHADVAAMVDDLELNIRSPYNSFGLYTPSDDKWIKIEKIAYAGRNT